MELEKKEIPEIFGADEIQWGDWHWQLSHSVRNPAELSMLPGWDAAGYEANSRCAARYPMLATPYYLSLARSFSMDDPVIRQCVPHNDELDDDTALPDPLGEDCTTPVSRLVHRYRDRALLLTWSCCAVRCRHCMRKRVWDTPLPPPSDSELEGCVKYLRENPHVREVLVSGGDPLVLEDAQVERILSALASVPSVEVLRIGSRTLTALPQRFTDSLCGILESAGKSVWIASHFNHPLELTAEAAFAVEKLLRHGIPVVNQSVLLKGINDEADTLAALFTGLLKMKIKPYYLFHGDPVRGTTCFRTGVEAGLKIMAELRSKVSGLAIPAYAFDLPEGGGKIRLEPDFRTGTAEDGAPVYSRFDCGEVAYR